MSPRVGWHSKGAGLPALLLINAAGEAGRSQGLSPHGDCPGKRRAACCGYWDSPLRGQSLKRPLETAKRPKGRLARGGWGGGSRVLSAARTSFLLPRKSEPRDGTSRPSAFSAYGAVVNDQMSEFPNVGGQSCCGAGRAIGVPFSRDCRHASMAGQSAALRVSFQTAAPNVLVATA
jgi:hypothetical protein